MFIAEAVEQGRHVAFKRAEIAIDLVPQRTATGQALGQDATALGDHRDRCRRHPRVRAKVRQHVGEW